MRNRWQSWINRIRETHAEVVWQSDPEPCEFIVGLRAVCWGLWLLLPMDTFGSLAPAYRTLAQLAPETVWGAWMFGLGVAVCWGITFGSLRLRRRLQFVHFLSWALISGAFLVANPAAAATQHLVTAVVCGWVYLRIGRYRKR